MLISGGARARPITTGPRTSRPIAPCAWPRGTIRRSNGLTRKLHDSTPKAFHDLFHVLIALGARGCLVMCLRVAELSNGVIPVRLVLLAVHSQLPGNGLDQLLKTNFLLPFLAETLILLCTSLMPPIEFMLHIERDNLPALSSTSFFFGSPPRFAVSLHRARLTARGFDDAFDGMFVLKSLK